MSEPRTWTDREILALRGPRNVVDPNLPYEAFVEKERTANGTVEDVAVVLITNRTCPFRCLFCDLWKNTTAVRSVEGQVAGQVEWALRKFPAAPHVKLYNAGNFFDDQAISRADRARITDQVAGRRTVIVECHPKLVDPRCEDFAARMEPRLQVALGLETIDPQVLPRLNKRMTVDDFARAVEFLLSHGIAVRAFIVLGLPYQTREEAVEWTRRSIDFAISIGVECCSLVAGRAGNGVMDVLQGRGEFTPPSLAAIEEVLDYGIDLRRGRVFMDLWGIERFFACATCGPARAERLREMNLSQQPVPRVQCVCGT